MLEAVAGPVLVNGQVGFIVFRPGGAGQRIPDFNAGSQRLERIFGLEPPLLALKAGVF